MATVKSFGSVSEIVSSLREQLSNNPKQALKALVILFNRQTPDEQANAEVHHSNGVGFTRKDSKILTSFAKQHINGKTLSSKQMYLLLSLIPKYARQLVIRAIDNGTYKKEGGRWVY